MAETCSNGYQFSSFSGSHNTSGSAEFSRLSELISTNIQKISQNVVSMQKMVNQLGTSEDCENLRSQLHQMQQYLNQLVKDTNNHLKDLPHIPNPTSHSEQIQRRVLRNRLTSQFSDAIKNFQEVQRMAAQKEKESVMRARAKSGLSVNPFGEDSSPHSKLIELSSPSQTQRTSLQIEEEVDFELLREREEAVRKIEADIADVNHIFTDLATLVHEQGEIIDSIEANVEQTQIQVSEGTEQLAKARQSQAVARRKSFYLIITLIIIAFIIGFLIWILS